MIFERKRYLDDLTAGRENGMACGIASFRDRDIAPLFAQTVGLENVCLPESFVKAIK